MVRKSSRISRKQRRTTRQTRKQRQTGGFNSRQVAKEFNLNAIKTQLNITATTVKSGEFGAIEKACLKGIDPPSCFGIKYVKLDPGQSNSHPLVIGQKRVLEHEIEIMIALKNAISNSPEIPYHSEQYVGALLPESKTPILFTEFIEGTTLSSPIAIPEINTNIISYYLQTILVLEQMSKLLPGFVHGDLNPGNIFLVKRPEAHPICKFPVAYTNEEGYDDELVYKFTEPYTIKLIDFGLSECDTIQWGQEHPSGPSQSIVGVWQLDAWMVLESFLNVASAEQQRILKKIATDFFGEDIASQLQAKETDIYRRIGELKELGERTILYKLCDEAVAKKHSIVADE